MVTVFSVAARTANEYRALESSSNLDGEKVKMDYTI